MSKEYSGTTMAASGSGLRGTTWLQNDIYGSEEHNDTVGQVASGSGRISSPLNQRSTRGAHGASIALNRSQRRRDNPSASPIRGSFTPAPSAPLSGTAPLQFTENLFTMDEEHFGDEQISAMSVTEVKPREFVQTEAGKEAWLRELREMTSRRLDFLP